MKATVDPERCAGQGACVATCSDVFALTDEGNAEVIVGLIPDESVELVRQAAQQCPERAITVGTGESGEVRHQPKSGVIDIQALHDKIEIHELLARYARGVDTQDWDLWKSVFTPDAVLDYSSAGIPVGSRDEIAAMFEEAFKTIPMAQHFISNVEVDLDGDQAKVRAMFFNPMHLPGMDEHSACGGYYHHEMVRTPDGWKSERLVEENVWFVNPPTASVSAT